MEVAQEAAEAPPGEEMQAQELYEGIPESDEELVRFCVHVSVYEHETHLASFCSSGSTLHAIVRVLFVSSLVRISHIAQDKYVTKLLSPLSALAKIVPPTPDSVQDERTLLESLWRMVRQHC